MYTQYDEKGKIFTPVVTKKPVAVTIQTATHLIRGNIHIKPEGRIKDIFSEDHFLAVTNATICEPTGKTVYRTHFLTVNQDNIIWLLPDEEMITNNEAQS